MQAFVSSGLFAARRLYGASIGVTCPPGSATGTGTSTGTASSLHSRTSTTMIRGFPNNFGGGSGIGGTRGASSTAFDVLEYPCVFTFKVIGRRQGDFMNDIVDSVAETLSTEKKNLKTTFRDHGKWRSITLRAAVLNKEQIYSVYAAISRDPRVKFKF